MQQLPHFVVVALFFLSGVGVAFIVGAPIFVRNLNRKIREQQAKDPE